MTISVSASELQKNFGLWHDRALKEPVRITDRGRGAAYLVSAETFQELWSSFHKAVAVGDLSEEEMVMIQEADVPEEHAYEIADLVDHSNAAESSSRS